MRKNYLSAPALSAEAVALAAVPPTGAHPCLSVEEEVVVLQEADELQNEIITGLDEAERVEDVSDTMLNIADTVEEAGGVTPEQAMLIDNASEMAVAGSDTDPDDVIPAMEPVVNGTVSVESFVEDLRKRAEDIWARIRKFITELWAKIVAYFRNIFSVAPRHLERIKKLREVIAVHKKNNTVAGKLFKPAVSILVGTAALSYPSYMVKNSSELNRGLSELKTAGNWVFGQYLKSVKSQGDVVATELKRFDPAKAAESLATVARGLPKINFTNVPNGPSTGYMGCFDIRASRIDKKNPTDGLSDAQVLNALRHTKVVVVNRDGTQNTFNREGFATMTFAEMETTLNEVEALLKQLVGHENSADNKALEKTRQDLIAGGNASTAAMAKFVAPTDSDKLQRAFAMDVMKSLQNFNTTYTGWASNLTVAFSKKIINVSRSTLVLVEKSLAQY